MYEIIALKAAGLPADFRGTALRQGDEGYAVARNIYNMRWNNNNPALILQPEDSEDLACLMRHMSAKRIPGAIRAGGHGVDGSVMPDDHVVIDLRRFCDLLVDPVSKTVPAGAGILLGDLDKATQQFGLVVPAGTVSTTGIAGLTLGGGVGYNMRRRRRFSSSNLARSRFPSFDGENAASRAHCASHSLMTNGCFLWRACAMVSAPRTRIYIEIYWKKIASHCHKKGLQTTRFGVVSSWLPAN